MTKPNNDFFNEEMAQNYDHRNSKLGPIKDSLHFIMNLIIKDLPRKSKVLCVGAGTGAEILSMAQAFPDWTFVALEPSESMLRVCEKRMNEAGLWGFCFY